DAAGRPVRGRGPPSTVGDRAHRPSRPTVPGLLVRGRRGSAPPVARGGGGVTIVEALTPRLRRGVSPYTGVVRQLEECLHAGTEPPHFRVACEVARGRSLLGAGLDHLSGVGGAGLTRSHAAAAAVGEALERYSATHVPFERLLVASARELGADAVAPERVALFSARPYPQP